jgi:hypothetical protein
VNGVGVVRHRDLEAGQLLTESYRSRTGGPRGLGERLEALQQLLGAADEGLPEPLPRLRVERREDLAAAGVTDDELGAGPLDPAGERVEGADAGGRQAEAGGEAAGGGDADPQAGERAGPEADGDQLDSDPAASGVGGPLDLAEQRGRVPGAPLGGEPQQRLVQRLAVAPGADGGVGGRGIEADDDQGGVASSS